MSQENWNAENIPSQKGRVAIVTGSSSGIGYETARVLANKQASAILAVRNLEKGNKALTKIRQQHPDGDVKVLLFTSSLKSITEKDFSQREQIELKY